MKKFHLILLLLGFAFLGFLVWHTGVHVLGRELLTLSWGIIPFIALEIIAEGIHTLGWRECLPPRRLSWYRVFQIRMAGYAINYLTPTANLGGEATRAAFLFAEYRGPDAVCGVLAGKLCLAISQVIFVVAGSAFLIGHITMPPTLWTALLASTGVVSVGLIAFFLLQKFGKLGGSVRWIAARFPNNQTLKAAAKQVTELDETLSKFYHERPMALVYSTGWSLVAHSTGILQAWWFLHFLHLPATFITATCIWVLGLWFDLLTFAVPLNAGTLEGSRMLAFKAVGLSSVPGMTYGIALRLAQMSCAVVGLIFYSRLVAKAPPANPDTPLVKKTSEETLARTGSW